MLRQRCALIAVVSLVLFGVGHSQAGPLEDFGAVRAALAKDDYKTALPLLRTLTAQNYAGAKYLLGTLYSNGLGVPKDLSAGFKLQRECAEQGHALCQYEAGAAYDRGLGVSRNLREAFRWFGRAAEQGYGMAQVNVAVMYAAGDGAAVDVVQAYKWLVIAAKGGGYMDRAEVKADAAKRLSMVKPQMKPAQVAEAQAQASGWRAKPEPLMPH